MEPTNAGTCSFEECSRPLYAKSYCSAHYKQQLAGKPLARLRPKPLPPIGRLQLNTRKSEGCWEWTLSLDKDGYGKFYVDGRSRHAHRVAYELQVGPVPDGFEVDHLCRNRRCVKPTHLEAVTRDENIRRMNMHRGATRSEAGHA